MLQLNLFSSNSRAAHIGGTGGCGTSCINNTVLVSAFSLYRNALYWLVECYSNPNTKPCCYINTN